MNSGEIRESLKPLIDHALAEAREANARIAQIAPNQPGPIRRVFIFETDHGFDWGTTREEFGMIEPLLSAKV